MRRAKPNERTDITHESSAALSLATSRSRDRSVNARCGPLLSMSHAAWYFAMRLLPNKAIVDIELRPRSGAATW